MSVPNTAASAPGLRYISSESESDSAEPFRGMVGRRVLFRAMIWGILGLIYAPLFLGLTSLLHGLGAGTWSYAGAAGIAGAVTAVLYGGREVGLLGAGIGLGVGGLLLFLKGEWITLELAVLAAMGVAVVIGFVPAFSGRCARNVPGTALAGLLCGVLAGSVVSIAEPLHPNAFPPFAVLAFLVSVNGVLYVGAVRRLVRLTSCVSVHSWRCHLVESLVIAIMAGFTAGSIWVVTAPFIGGVSDLVRATSDAIYQQIPAAIPGAIFGGAVAGALLELFGFRWVHEV